MSDGKELEFEKIVWCSSLDGLLKGWKGDKTALTKGMKKLPEGVKGINIDMVLSKPMFSSRNTIVFPFKYKDYKMRALGVAEETVGEGLAPIYTVHWMLFLVDDFADDREEVAKSLRAFRRELSKEFPEMTGRVISDRISYLPVLSGEEPVAMKSLQLHEGVFYLGPQAKRSDSKEGLRNLDQILDNAAALKAWVAETVAAPHSAPSEAPQII